MMAYFVAAASCFASLYLSEDRRIADGLLIYTSGPFALASIALGAAAHHRRAAGWFESLIAVAWGVSAVVLCVSVSSPPLSLQEAFLAMQLQTVAAGLAAAAMIAAAANVSRAPDAAIARVAHAIALVAVASFCGWRFLTGMGVFDTGGIAGVAKYLDMSQRVLCTSAAVILIATFVPWSQVGARHRTSA